MKRWQLIVAVFVTFFVGDRLGGFALEQLLYKSPQRFSKLYSGRLNGEIVCLGNSRGVVTLNTKIISELTGRSAVNISHNGMSAQIGRAIFADYLEHSVKPRTLIVEVSFVTTQTSQGQVAEYIPFWNRSARLEALGTKYCPRSVGASQVTWLYRNNSELYWAAFYYLLRRYDDQNSSMPGTVSNALVKESEALAPFDMEIQPDELAALKEIVETARENGIEVTLLYAPYLPAYAARIENLDAMIATISQATSVAVIDLTRAIQHTDRFADRVHVNRQGTLEMVNLLVERGAFN